MKQIISIDPWPADPIDHYQTVADGAWGYLIIYDDLSYEFDTSQCPTPEEIYRRWPRLNTQVANSKPSAQNTSEICEKPSSELAF